MRFRSIATTATAAALALGLAACGSDDSSSSNASADKKACSKADLATYAKGKLTIGTDKPAFPPYFVDDKPANGKGFESATAYAVAKQLGFSPAEVSWTVVPFNSSYAPGKKKFDIDLNQVSINPQRAKRVDFSTPYYTAPQAVLALNGSKAASAKSLADLQDAKLGVQVGTTSLDAVQQVIKPSNQPQVFNDSNDTVRALKNKRVDGIVLDLPTAIYLRDAELDGATVSGQFDAPGGGDKWGILLAKGSPLTACVNDALAKLDSSGALTKITDTWMNQYAKAPKLQ